MDATTLNHFSLSYVNMSKKKKKDTTSFVIIENANSQNSMEKALGIATFNTIKFNYFINLIIDGHISM